MNCLRVVSDVADRELDVIRTIVDGWHTASGLDDVLSIVQACSRSSERPGVLDLMGHSRSPGFVVIGSWIIDDSPQTTASFSLLLRPLLLDAGIGVIRLLACSTAATPRGRDVLRNVGRVTGCEVLGTPRNLHPSDYGRAGLRGDDELVDQHGKRVGSAIGGLAASFR